LKKLFAAIEFRAFYFNIINFFVYLYEVWNFSLAVSYEFLQKELLNLLPALRLQVPQSSDLFPQHLQKLLVYNEKWSANAAEGNKQRNLRGNVSVLLPPVSVPPFLAFLSERP
jgi:hypothetical protein